MSLETLQKPEVINFVVSSFESTLVDYDDNEDPIVTASLTLEQVYEPSLADQNVTFVQTEELTEAGVAVQPYGAFLMNFKAPTAMTESDLLPVIRFDDGTEYVGNASLFDLHTGDSISFGIVS